MTLLLLVPFCSHAVEVPRHPTGYVVDLAGIIDPPMEKKIDGLLRELEQKTTAQMVILTIRSLEGESLEGASIRIAHDKWRLGQKGKDNGVLVLIASEDRKFRIEVGYGLEGVLPDSFVGSVGRTSLTPYFRKGDYAGGVFAAAGQIAGKIAEEAGVALTGLPETTEAVPKKEPTGPIGSLFTLFVILAIAFLFIRHPRALLLFFLLSGRGRRGTWGGRGSGFGGGGFGGGGGGGFGGGGASGRW
jgi:uncharacterized protein